MSRYFIQLSYFGKNFNGWQIQKNSKETVQQYLQDALSLIYRESIEVVGCGRTDTGVHAKKYFAHFDLDAEIISEKSKWINKLNKILPDDISIRDLMEVKPDASARFDALSRSYQYHIHNHKNPFLTDLSYSYAPVLDVKKMNKAAKVLFEFEDFSCFSKSNTQTFTNNCSIHRAEWEQTTDGLIFHVSANRFLRNMVRAIVGTLLLVGEGKIDEKQFVGIIESKSRTKAGRSVPAHGLYLTEIIYPKEIYI